TVAEPSRSEPDAGRRFEPVDPDLFDFDDLQPRGTAGRRGRADVETGHLTFHGGTVLASPDVVPVYVGDYWQTLPGKRDRARNDAAMAALVKDPGQTALWHEYGAGPGTTSRSKVLAGVGGEQFTKEHGEALVGGGGTKGQLGA